MFFSNTRNIAFGFSFLLAASISVLGQTATPTPKIAEDDQVVKVNSRLIIVPVSVTDPNGQPILGLKADNFRISEEGKQQTIDQVGDAEKVPLEIALLIDVSGSVNPLFEFEKSAAGQFLKSVMKPEDHATIFLVGDKPTVLAGSQNATDAAQTLQTVMPAGKFTAFYDTVTAATAYLRKNAPERSRRVVVALTDGEDNWSSMTQQAEQDTYRNVDVSTLTQDKRNQLAAQSDVAHKKAQAKVLKDLQNADTVFYSVNPAGNSYRLNKISVRAQDGMSRFAVDTGGTSFLPAFSQTDTKDSIMNTANARKNAELLETIFRQLSNELRAQYLVQYYSESEFPANKYVKLDVAVNRPSTRIRARLGYYVKE
jgi:VWFA-related protein